MRDLCQYRSQWNVVLEGQPDRSPFVFLKGICCMYKRYCPEAKLALGFLWTSVSPYRRRNYLQHSCFLRESSCMPRSPIHRSCLASFWTIRCVPRLKRCRCTGRLWSLTTSATSPLHRTPIGGIPAGNRLLRSRRNPYGTRHRRGH